MDNEQLQKYLNKTQVLSVQGEHNEDKQQELLKFVDIHLAQSEGVDAFEQFFKGEKAYYNKQYKLALKYYSMARSVPNFRFFCHRATAQVFKTGGRIKEAIDFAKKALHLYPTDFHTLKALGNLLKVNKNEEEAKLVEERIAALDYESRPLQLPLERESLQEEERDHQPVVLGKKELDELTGIFSFSDGEFAQAPLKEEEGEQERMRDSALHLQEFEELPAHGEALEELKKLAEEERSLSSGGTSKYLERSLRIDGDHESSLEKRVEQFQKRQTKLISHYVEQAHKREDLTQDFLYILNGWNYQQEKDLTVPGLHSKISSFLLPEYRRKTCGGLFLRWNGKGIAINPGMNFLENFHHYGLYVKDIDYVLVTRDNMDSYSDVKGIYDLNYQHNTVSNELHVIHYYLNQKAYDNIATSLKPSFKQERNTIHCLELYIDSPDVETLSLCEGVSLRYFQHVDAESTRKNEDTGPFCLGVRLELHSSKTSLQPLSFGLASGIPWSPLLAKNLQGCDVLVAGFEKTNADDYSQVKCNDDCLGYFGTYRLVSEAHPRLLLCCEFSGREGDIRVEVVKKMREELRRKMGKEPVILPGDTGLYLDLDTFRVQCSVSRALVDPQKIRVAKSSESFGDLQYLCPSCFI